MLNEQLRHELLSMQEADQRLLQALLDAGGLREREYHPRMKAVHDENNTRLKAIIDEHGWPGHSLVGVDGAKAAWLVAQHAVSDIDFMERTLELLRSAVQEGEAEGWCLAFLQDRVPTMAGKPQIYGTQHDFDESGMAYPLPVDSPDKVDALRREIGLEPISEATKRIQERYHSMSRNSRDDK